MAVTGIIEFVSIIKRVEAKTGSKGKAYVEMRLDAIRCDEINLEEAKNMMGKMVRVHIQRLDIPLPGMEQ